MKNETLISKARDLARADKIDEAREMLLKGFEEAPDAALERAFDLLIPVSPELKKYEALLSALASKDNSARKKAMMQVAREAGKFLRKDSGAWLLDPRTTARIIAATSDPDPKVVEYATIALVEITRRYYRDRRALAVILRGLDSPTPNTRRWAIEGARLFGGAQYADRVLGMADDPSSVVRSEVVAYLTELAREALLPEDLKTRAFNLAAGLLTSDDHQFRSQGANLLRELGDKKAVPLIEGVRSKEKHKLTHEVFDIALQVLKDRSTAGKSRRTEQ